MITAEPSPGNEPAGAPVTPLNLPAPAVPLVEGELITPGEAPEPTRTALKRAMRTRAQAHADEAIAVLVANMRNIQLAADKRENAANRLLEWGFGKPATEIEAGEGAQLIVIRKFGEQA